mgnify:CR=1 FL=1
MTEHTLTDIGLHCPACGQTERLHIVTSDWAAIDGDGIDTMADDLPAGGLEFAPESPARCPLCDWRGTVRDTEKAAE